MKEILAVVFLSIYRKYLILLKMIENNIFQLMVMILMGSYKPCTHPHPPTLTHTHPYSPIPTNTHPHPPTPSQKRSHSLITSQKKKVTLTHNHPHPANKKVTLTHTHPHPDKKGHTQPKLGHTHPHITEIKNVTCLIHTYRCPLFTILAGVLIFEKD